VCCPQLELAVRLGQRDGQRVRVRGVHPGQGGRRPRLHLLVALHLVQVVGHLRCGGLRRGPLPAALEVSGGQRGAVGELLARLEIERPLRAVVVRGPGIGDTGVLVTVGPDLDQTGEELLGDQGTLGLLDVVRVDRRRLGEPHAEHPAGLARDLFRVRRLREPLPGLGRTPRGPRVALLAAAGEDEPHDRGQGDGRGGRPSSPHLPCLSRCRGCTPLSHPSGTRRTTGCVPGPVGRHARNRGSPAARSDAGRGETVTSERRNGLAAEPDSNNGTVASHSPRCMPKHSWYLRTTRRHRAAAECVRTDASDGVSSGRRRRSGARPSPPARPRSGRPTSGRSRSGRA
jgi:hypothetical protein